MKEQELYLLITRYLSDQTSEAENAWLADWLAADKSNQQTFEEVKRVWQGHQRISDEESIQALSVLRARIAAGEQRVVPAKSRRLQFYWFAAAASLLVALLAAWYLFPTKSNNSRLSYLTIVTKPGEKKIIRLEDSTRIVLGPGSQLSYPKVFDKDNRTVSVKGQAYFEVSQAPGKPFIVQTSVLSVQVLGTHFNVHADPDQPASTVALLEGSVKIRLEGDRSWLLKPGQEISVDHRTRQAALNPLDSATVLGWQQNVLVFKNEQFGSVAPRIEKMYGVKIIFNNEEAAETRLYAQFKDEPLENVLSAICISGVLTYRQQGDTIYVTMKKSS
ncbi:FecR family protein [Chitinophaga terrae (ex Kim and Jung 2007)]|uniref:FecR family protein n=1 Tax=Chitinophaga terrae (ex Kim and Jung 2007) TaxID=408074 RepID=A0A1H4EG19_9BACT|nr:FecR family protein [Chitinophaga terrae (ex Kim and Jung 2007)]MDQ0109574.1 ferric-dicitrate binding protein FerR (iron transport regulator) [Chitinophaga terrae (ex Kim and Jung 2007)]SEA83769.1 FecR family protein [Chitinophaga terrae (ex Kim and Jung 2007)]